MKQAPLNLGWGLLFDKSGWRQGRERGGDRWTEKEMNHWIAPERVARSPNTSGQMGGQVGS